MVRCHRYRRVKNKKVDLRNAAHTAKFESYPHRPNAYVRTRAMPDGAACACVGLAPFPDDLAMPIVLIFYIFAERVRLLRFLGLAFDHGPDSYDEFFENNDGNNNDN